MVGQI